MNEVYATDQRAFHRKILRMATVIVDEDYIWADTTSVWDATYLKDHIKSTNVSCYKQRVHWVRSKIESELVRRANNVLLPIDMSVVPNLYTCKAVVTLQILSGTYKALLSQSKSHLKSRQFILDNVQTFSKKTVERTLADALATGIIVAVTPDTTSRTKVLYVTTAEYRRQFVITAIAMTAVEIAWGIVDSMGGDSGIQLATNCMSFWTDKLNHGRAIIDYAVSEIVIMQSKYIGED